MRGCGLAVLAAVVLCLAQDARAQALEHLKIGGDVQKAVAALGAPGMTGAFKDYKQSKWKRPSGNDISISVKDDRIAYIELDWGGTPDGTKTEMFGFIFGATSLTDIREKLGSNGMAFQRRAASAPTPAGVVMLNSYDVAGTVVTFYCVINDAEKDAAMAAKDDDAAFGRFAKLEAISLASTGYADENWGQRILDPKYKKVAP